jgi:hypothetical protein
MPTEQKNAENAILTHFKALLSPILDRGFYFLFSVGLASHRKCAKGVDEIGRNYASGL